jgi:hypothetical protein
MTISKQPNLELILRAISGLICEANRSIWIEDQFRHAGRKHKALYITLDNNVEAI